MKEVQLIKFDSEDVLVGDYEDRMSIHHCNGNETRIENSFEYIPPFINLENIRIQKVVDDGREHYIAVTRKVWEYIHLIENPVTAESQEREINRLNSDLSGAKITIESNAIRYKKIVNASLWVRFKWLFNGMDIV